MKHDLPVYLLHNDGSETTVEDREQITEHEGIFGIEKGDWENERKLRSMQAELSDKYGVQYMIKRRWKIREKKNISIKSSKSLLHISRCIVTK